MSNNSAVDLSVIIIARNEEATIGKNLEVLIPETHPLNAEIIVVDSGSTDSTFAIAQRFPVTILRIEDSPLRSPAAARYLGTLHARGRFIYYMDGDMIVCPGWLQAGMNELRNPSVGGIAGRIYSVDPGEAPTMTHPDGLPLGDVETLHTSGMYRKDVIDQTFTFNPFLKGEEEHELAYRLQRNGFRTVRVEIPMGYHVYKEKSTVIEQRKTSYFAGHGQLLRRYKLAQRTHRFFKDYILLYLEIFALYVGTVVVILSLVKGLTSGPSLLFLEVLGFLLFLCFCLMAWKGPKRVYFYFRKRFTIPFYVLKGFLLGLPDPPGYEELIRYTVHQGAK